MSASSDRDSQPPTKRPRIYRACLPCVSSKTRCQDVTAAGCYRCRTKHLQCSLLEGAIEPGPSTQGLNGTSDGEVDELRFRLAQVEATSRELQARVRHLEERPALTRPNSAHQIPTQSSLVHTADTPATGGNLTRMLSWTVVAPDFVFDERLLCISDLQTPPDPVAQGLVSRAQMDMSFHMLKHQLSLLLPIPSLLLTSTPTPHNPFVRLAILSHSSLYNEAIADQIDASIRHVMSGDLTRDTVFALLILSLAPQHEMDAARARPTALRLVSLAYDIGLSLGLEALARVALRHGDDLCHPWFDERLELVLLWETVKNRYSILHMIGARGGQSPVSLASLMPRHRSDHFRQSIRHVQAEARVVSAFAHLNSILEEGEAVTDGGGADGQELLDSWTTVRHQVSEMLSGEHGALYQDYVCISVLMGIRIAGFFQRMPFPVDPQLKLAGLPFMGTQMQAAVGELLRVCNSMSASELAALPAYKATVLILTVILARRVLSYAPPGADPDWRPFTTAEVVAADEKVRALGGAAAIISGRADEMESAFRTQAAHWTGESHATTDFANLEALFNFDLFGLEGFFQPLQQTPLHTQPLAQPLAHSQLFHA